MCGIFILKHYYGSGSASVDIKGEKKDFMEKTEIQFNGDFILEEGFPGNFEAAVKTFQSLSSKYYGT